MPRRVPHQLQTHKVTFGSESFAVELTYSDRANLKITVHPDQRVVVQAPLGKPLEEVLRRVCKRAAWIIRQIDNFDRFQPLPSERRYVTGETHWYLGRKYRLKVRTAGENRVTLTRGVLWVYVSSNSSDKVRDLLESWYCDRLRRVFAERYERARAIAIRAGLPEPQFASRLMRRRWGSCAKSGRITLNTELIKAPISSIDYVIIHELCHLKYKNHSREFYRLLTRLLPDWQDRKTRLERVHV
jgi:predicted metal-dependent hydrolase